MNQESGITVQHISVYLAMNPSAVNTFVADRAIGKSSNQAVKPEVRTICFCFMFELVLT